MGKLGQPFSKAEFMGLRTLTKQCANLLEARQKLIK